MDLLMTILMVLAGLYLGPQLAPNGRWVALVATIAVAAVLVAWFGWVEQQTGSIGRAVAGLLVILGAAAAGLGVSVRILVLWRGWEGGRRTVAVGLGGAMLALGVTLLFTGAFSG